MSLTTEPLAKDVLVTIAEKFGTPTYVYDAAAIAQQYAAFKEALQGLPHLLCYAVKANGNLTILNYLRQLGSGFEVFSGGELARALQVGAEPQKIVFGGVGKRDDEIVSALEAGVLYISVESAAELLAIAELAQGLKKVASISLRVNPDVDARTHPHIATGMKQNKFGIPLAEARQLAKSALEHPWLKFAGVTCHIGSQILDIAPFTEAAHLLAELVKELQGRGVKLLHLGMGGGIGIVYNPARDRPLTFKAYGEMLRRILGPLKLPLTFELGRSLVGQAGLLLSRVVRTKVGETKKFVLLDAGMNDLIRPAFYEAYHEIELVARASSTAGTEGASASQPVVVDVVGPVCESSDVFAKERALPPLAAGDLVALKSAGAYGLVMSSNYCGRLRPAEVWYQGPQFYLCREREQLADLWRGEKIVS